MLLKIQFPSTIKINFIFRLFPKMLLNISRQLAFALAQRSQIFSGYGFRPKQG